MIVSGSIASDSSPDSARTTSPQARARGGSTSHNGAGNHFIQVARPQISPPTRPLENCAPNSPSASSRLMFPVSRFAMTGNHSSAARIAVGRGRRAYAQRIDHRSSVIVPARQANQATSHGSSAHGANSGSIQGA